MNERQRDLFLWQWSRRRERGFARVALYGALIGAAGGLVFAAVLFSGMGGGGNHSTESFLVMLRTGATLFGLSIPAFAWIGYSGATRVFSANETMYQSLLESGASVPQQPPVLRTSDRGPMIAVIVTVVIIVAFIGVVAFKYG